MPVHNGVLYCVEISAADEELMPGGTETVLLVGDFIFLP
jgi:hypothetical protein